MIVFPLDKALGIIVVGSQYIAPCDAGKLSHAELVVVDEAAAIPLSQVKALIGSCNAIMASTING